MASRRKVRRTAGWIARYVSDDLLQRAAQADGRSSRGSTRPAMTLLKATLLGLLAGCKGLGEVEELTADLPRPVRKLLGIPGRIPDTTLRDFLVKVDPMVLHQVLWVAGYDATRRKALRQRDDVELPFGVMSADGKYPSVSDTKRSAYVQVHHDENGNPSHGLVRTMTCCLATAVGRPILGAVPIPGCTNEKGAFQKAFGDMVRYYGRRFRLLMYDAGAASKDNADAVKAAGKEYLFLIADPRWQMLQTTELLLTDTAPQFVQEQKVSERKRVVRKLTLRSVKPAHKNTLLWEHTRTVFRVVNEVYEDDELVSTYTRYSVSSLEAKELQPEQWLELHVIRWDVETAHSILDTAFAEDERPWIRASAQGNLAVQLLRRVAYTLMTLYKHVTIRNEDDSLAPWRRHFEWVKDMLKWATSEDVANLRPRTYSVPPALA